MNKVKTFANSYLYTRIPDYERNILNFVMKADRIDKQSEAFLGIIEDTKRRQTSAVLSRVLAREDVILGVSDKGLPASFKVFACKDLRTDSSVKVFIDCSGLITLKNGYYVCNKIDVFCTYLLAAMTMLVYNSEPMRIITNSTIVQNGTECFVSLASHIFDYLRLNGYAENRIKINYILAMYFQVSMLGLNREDTSVKNLAAKVAGVQHRDINAMEIYYSDEDLLNIDTILKCITNTFKTKGMSTDVFVDKWNWFYGTGTHFACELFTSFSTMITNAYCGSYINNQKTIEKCCGRSMVEYTNAILRVGTDAIDVGFRYESGIDRDSYDRSITVTQEALFNKRITKEMKITIEDLEGNASDLTKKIKTLSDKGYKNDKERSKGMKSIYLAAIGTVSSNYLAAGTSKKYNNMISTVVKAISRDLLIKEKEYVINGLANSITGLTKNLANDPKAHSNAKAVIADCKTALKVLDPKNAVLSESKTEGSFQTE